MKSTAPDNNCAHNTQRKIDFPCSEIYRALSHSELLARWWGPKDFRNTFDECDFRTGGAWRFTMHGPDGTDYPNESRFLEIVENERVVIEHISVPHFILTITLTPVGDSTVVDWCQRFDSADQYRQLAAIVESANEQNLDRLTAVVTENRVDAESGDRK